MDSNSFGRLHLRITRRTKRQIKSSLSICTLIRARDEDDQDSGVPAIRTTLGSELWTAPTTQPRKDFTYAAPVTNISTVLALVKPANVAMKRIVAMMMTTIRAVTLLRELHMITGTKRKQIMSDAKMVRAACIKKEPDKIKTFGSPEISSQRLCHHV
jgi:hypothetical protein